MLEKLRNLIIDVDVYNAICNSEKTCSHNTKRNLLHSIRVSNKIARLSYSLNRIHFNNNFIEI